MWKNSDNWFVEWFDSPAYHDLYAHRDDAEAAALVDAIQEHVLQGSISKILDVACGSGRHARAFAEHGHDVIGMDLSKQSLIQARSLQREGIRFIHGDMRHLTDLFEASSFDCITLLFTSFGYFDHDDVHVDVLRQVHRLLRPGGTLVLDYLNTTQVQKLLVPEETVQTTEHQFFIQRTIDAKWISKAISFDDNLGQSHVVTERVRNANQFTLEEWAASAGFKKNTFRGNYRWEHFSEESPRCILVAVK